MLNKIKNLSFEQRDELLTILKSRFFKNMKRHQGFEWTQIEAKLFENEEKLFSLFEMERTGGEPDFVALDENEVVFIDCSQESPIGRRSFCYDREALESRKENRPKGNVIDMALEMGIEILTEKEYRRLQEFGKFDTKTSSWIKTPDNIRKLGGALFCDNRYDTVFVYHNGAQSYYSSRGFRGLLRL